MAAFATDELHCLAPNPLPERGASYSLDASPDGSKLVYGSGYSVVVRDVDNPADCKVYVGHKKRAGVAKFSPDGRLVASGDAAGVVRVWSVDGAMDTKKELPCMGGSIFDIAWDHTGKRMAVCGDAKGTNARAFMWESGSPQGELAGTAKRVLSCSIRPGAPSRLATGSEDMKVRLHAGPPYKFTNTVEEHKNFVQCVRYSPDGSLLATAGSDKLICILDAETGELKAKLPVEHAGSIYAVSWSDDSTKLLSCSGDKSVKVWDVAAEKSAMTLSLGRQVPDMQVGCVFAGAQAISLSLSGDINYVDINGGKVSRMVQAHNSTPVNIARDWAADGVELYVGSSDGDVFSFQPDGNAVRFEGSKPGSNDGVTVSKGRFFSVGHDDVMRSCDVTDGAYSFKPATMPISATPIGIDSGPADPGLVVTGTAETVVLARDGKQKDVKPFKGYEALCVAMSPDCKEVAVGGSDKKVHIFTIEGDKLKPTDIELAGLQGPCSALRYSPNGNHIAVGDKVKEVTLWDRESRECLIKSKWVFHQSSITALAFSPSGQYVASGSTDTQVIIWNVDKKMAKTKIHPAHALGVVSVEWMDDETVVSGGNDGCVRRWTPKLPK